MTVTEPADFVETNPDAFTVAMLLSLVLQTMAGTPRVWPSLRVTDTDSCIVCPSMTVGWGAASTMM